MKTIPIPAGMQTKVFVLEPGAAASVPELLNRYFAGKTPRIIADGNTWRAAGEKVQDLLSHAFANTDEPVIFPAEPRLHPDDTISRKLAESFTAETVPVAVGSGVINDLVKVASGYAGLPYLCVPTAASVDGYTSSGGSMTVGGRKVTVPCPAPYAVAADPEILASAPPEMLASGYADLLTKMPAGADWMIAETLGLEPINKTVWSLVQDELRDRVADPRNLAKIFLGLAATGYAMQLYKDSRPASGAEHMFSHVLEMEGNDASHGFKVGVGTVAIMHLMEFVMETPASALEKDALPLQTKEERLACIRDLLKKGCYGSGMEETALAKFQEGDAGIRRRELIREKWDLIRQRIRTQLYSLERVRKMLADAGAPVTASGIGLKKEQFLHAVRTSQLIRKRYVVTDLLYEAGLLEKALLRLDDML